MSKPPPRLLRSMPQAKQAAKVIHEAIHTTATAAGSASSGRKGKRDLVQGLLALSVRARTRSEPTDGLMHGREEDLGEGAGKMVGQGRSITTAAGSGTSQHKSHVRPGSVYLRAQATNTTSAVNGVVIQRPYNSSTYNPQHTTYIPPNPSPFTFPLPTSNPALSKWFDSNASCAQSSRPPSPPSPTPSPGLESDLPSVDASAGSGPPPSTFTLAACTSSQHQHVPPTTLAKGKARALYSTQPMYSRSLCLGDQPGADGLFGLGGGKGTSSSGSSMIEREGEKSILVFHPGAYGIPKKRYASTSNTPPTYTHPNLPLEPHSRPSTSSSPDLSTSPSTSIQIGEDAYYTHTLSLGIADGVGGWSSSRNKGIRSRADPGRFSLLLMGFCEEEVKGWERGDEEWMVEGFGVGEGLRRRERKNQGSHLAFGTGRSSAPQPRRPPASGQTWMFDPPPAPTPSSEDPSGSSNLEEGIVFERTKKDLCPVEVMQRGYERCLASLKEEGIFGSATCLLAVLNNDELRVANLGDCAIVVIRGGEIVFRTEEMQHSFNFPLQLGTNSRDEPMKDAQLFKVKVQKNDIVIMCSDGLVDNLFDEDILEIIASFASPSALADQTILPPFSPQGVSEALCRAAKSASEEPGSPSPFMCKALDEGIDFIGGKKDDISVLVAVVQHRDESVSDI